MTVDADGFVFHSVLKLADLREGKGKKIQVDGEEIALWLVRGTVYAISNVCAHQHFSMMHDGSLEGLSVSCPMHGWSFSLETGKATSGSGAVATYPVKIDGGKVFVGIRHVA
jgi:nitrite reductase/ring-hydroxylating ferredoxin subunit